MVPAGEDTHTPYCQEHATPGMTTCKWTDGWISLSPAAAQLVFDLAKEADCNALRKHHLDFLSLTRTLYMSLTDNHNRAFGMEAGRIRSSILGARAMCKTLVL